jgi:hypothetical protein
MANAVVALGNVLEHSDDIPTEVGDTAAYLAHRLTVDLTAAGRRPSEVDPRPARADQQQPTLWQAAGGADPEQWGPPADPIADWAAQGSRAPGPVPTAGPQPRR